jgi:hypothetical protein
VNVYQFQNYESFHEGCKEALEFDKKIEVYTPVPHEEIFDLLGIKQTRMNATFYAGAVGGLVTAALITLIPNMVTFPINVGGRPLNSWPAFVIIGFELMVLFGGFASVGAFLLSNRFPRYDRTIFFLKDFVEQSHGEYFITSQKELNGVKAHRHYRIDAP